jgi:hypothetical protein
MEDGGAHPDEGHRSNDHREGGGLGEHHEPQQRGTHAGHQREGLRAFVRPMTHQGLQDGRRQLEGERDQSDLSVVQLEGILHQGVDRRDQRLHRVVQQVREGDGEKDRENGALGAHPNGAHARPWDLQVTPRSSPAPCSLS